jgi:hypothetical protein
MVSGPNIATAPKQSNAATASSQSGAVNNAHLNPAPPVINAPAVQPPTIQLMPPVTNPAIATPDPFCARLNALVSMRAAGKVAIQTKYLLDGFENCSADSSAGDLSCTNRTQRLGEIVNATGKCLGSQWRPVQQAGGTSFADNNGMYVSVNYSSIAAGNVLRIGRNPRFFR